MCVSRVHPEANANVCVSFRCLNTKVLHGCRNGTKHVRQKNCCLERDKASLCFSHGCCILFRCDGDGSHLFPFRFTRALCGQDDRISLGNLALSARWATPTMPPLFCCVAMGTARCPVLLNRSGAVLRVVRARWPSFWKLSAQWDGKESKQNHTKRFLNSARLDFYHRMIVANDCSLLARLGRD